MPPRHEIAPIIDAWFVGSKNWTSRSLIPYEIIAVIKYVSQMSANVQSSHILLPSIFKYSFSKLLVRLTSVKALFSCKWIQLLRLNRCYWRLLEKYWWQVTSTISIVRHQHQISVTNITFWRIMMLVTDVSNPGFDYR